MIEAPQFLPESDWRYTAIFSSDRDAREAGASNGRTRPWLDVICASRMRLALANKVFMATADASR